MWPRAVADLSLCLNRSLMLLIFLHHFSDIYSLFNYLDLFHKDWFACEIWLIRTLFGLSSRAFYCYCPSSLSSIICWVFVKKMHIYFSNFNNLQFTPPTIYQPRKLWSVIGFYYCMDFFYKQNWNTYKKRFDWMFSGHRQWNRFVKHMWPTYVEEPQIATTAWGQERARFSNLSPFVIGLSVQIWGPCWLGNRPIRIPVEPRQRDLRI